MDAVDTNDEQNPLFMKLRKLKLELLLPPSSYLPDFLNRYWFHTKVQITLNY